MGLFGDKKSEEVMVADHKLVCPVCGNDHFFERQIQMNTAGMTFLDMDWANKSAQNYYCDNCGYIFWFHPL